MCCCFPLYRRMYAVSMTHWLSWVQRGCEGGDALRSPLQTFYRRSLRHFSSRIHYITHKQGSQIPFIPKTDRLSQRRNVSHMAQRILSVYRHKNRGKGWLWRKKFVFVRGCGISLSEFFGLFLHASELPLYSCDLSSMEIKLDIEYSFAFPKEAGRVSPSISL